MVRIKLLIFICLTAACLTGCKAEEGNISEIDSTTITVAVRNGEKTVWESVTDDFRVNNPGLNLKFIELGSEFEQYRLLTSALSSGECAFDIMEIEDVWMEEFEKSGYIEPPENTADFDSGYIGFAREAFEREGILYAVPFQMDIGMILAANQYNWDGDLYSLKSEEETDKYISGDSSEKSDIISTVMELVAYTGGDAEAALVLYRDIYGKNPNGEAALKLFGEGELSVVRTWSSVLAKFRDERHNVSGNFQVFNMPGGKDGEETSVAKIFAMAISSLTENKKQCEEFIKYCSSDAFQTSWTELTGTYPVKKLLFDNPTIKSEWNHISPMKERIEHVQIRPRMLRYTENTDKLLGGIEQYLSEEASLGNVSGQLRQFLENK